MRLWVWLNRLIGRHVCEEYTQWRVLTGERDRAPTYQEFTLGGASAMITVVVRWQERSCTICGRLQQRMLSP